MYLAHFGLTEAPFRITPHPDFFYAGAQRGEILAALRYALSYEDGIIKVTGEVGTGKTMLLRMLIEQLPADVLPVWLANPGLTPDDLLQSIATQIGAGSGTATAPGALLDAIQHRLIALFADGRRAVALVDEAHAMSSAALDQIRLLSNLETPRQKLLQIVLFGQPELDEILATRRMRPLRERITHHFVLTPLNRREQDAYVAHRLHAAGYRGRMPFTRPALWALARAARGMTRRVNILADKALLAAFSEATHDVGFRHVRLAIRDAGLHLFRPTWLALAAGIGLALLLGATSLALLKPLKPATPPGPIKVMPATPAAPVTPPVARPSPQPAPRLPLEPLLGHGLASRIDDSRRTLATTDGSQWCIQLLAADPRNADKLDRFAQRLESAATGQPVLVYAAPGAPVGRIGIVWGIFGSRIEAGKALATLPGWARTGSPYARTIASIRPATVAPTQDIGLPPMNSVNIQSAPHFSQESRPRP